MHCYLQAHKFLVPFYKSFCSRVHVAKSIALAVSCRHVHRNCSLLYVYISLAVITKSSWNNAGVTGALLQALAFLVVLSSTTCFVCYILAPCGHERSRCPCVWDLVLFRILSSSPIRKDVCYDSSSVSHLFYVQTWRAAVKNLCHKFFNDCVKVVQNALVCFQNGASFLCNQDTYMLVPSRRKQLLT